MIGKLKTKLAARKTKENTSVKFDVGKTKKTFQIALDNFFDYPRTEDSEAILVTVGKCEEVLERPPGNRKPWISGKICQKQEVRKQLTRKVK